MKKVIHHRLATLLSLSVLLMVATASFAENPTKLSIRTVAPDMATLVVTGPLWKIYLEGPIDDESPERFLAEIRAKNIKSAFVHLNSPGGNLFAGMRLGRHIRDAGFSTYVGKSGSKRFESSSGECYSAGVLAFIGGYFRYNKSGSIMGVHPFSGRRTTGADMDVAQVVAAAITNYLSEMGVDVALFDRMSRAGKDEILLLSEAELRRLRVVNNGALPAKWSIEAVEGAIYLIGVQQTWVGTGKVSFWCQDKGTLVFIPWYTAGNNARMIADSAVGHSLRVDDEFIPLGKIRGGGSLAVINDSVFGAFDLSQDHINQLMNARSIGYAAQSPNPDFYYGFSVDTTGGLEKIQGYIKNCMSK